MEQNYLNSIGSRPRCECHECTQARWKMSTTGQLQGAWGNLATFEQIAKSRAAQAMRDTGGPNQNG